MTRRRAPCTGAAVLVVAAALDLLAAPRADALTRRVPADYPTVAAALAAASPGDSVALSPGEYDESVSLTSGVTLLAAGGPGSATLRAAPGGAAVDAVNPAVGTRLVGLVLSDGHGVNDGGLTEGGDLRVFGGALEVDDCTFAAGQASFGGGSAAIGATVAFHRCRWTGGSATYGGGHFQSGGSLTLDAATFQGGAAASGGGVFATGGAQVTITGATFQGCQASGDGGGIWLDSSVATLSNALFDGTQAQGHGGGLAVAAGGQVLASASIWVATTSGLGGGAFHVSCASGGPITKSPAATVECALLSLTHCDVIRAGGAAPAAGAVTDAASLQVATSVIAGNASGLACLDPRATLDVSCTDLYQNNGADVSGSCAPSPGANLLAVDPYLCDLAGRDFGLCANSPLLAPPSCDAYWGARGQACGACGATPAAPATWGQVKARYRR